MHPLVAAIKRLDHDSQYIIDRYLVAEGMSVKAHVVRLARLRDPNRTKTGFDGTDIFILMTKMRNASRKFRKLAKKLMKHAPQGIRTPAGEPEWEMAAHRLKTLAFDSLDPKLRRSLRDRIRRNTHRKVRQSPMFRRPWYPAGDDLWYD